MHSSGQRPLPHLSLSIHWFEGRLGSFRGELSVHTHTGVSGWKQNQWHREVKRTQRCARPRSYQLERAHCAPLFPTPCSVSTHWWLETPRGVRIYTMESNRWYNQCLPHPHSPSQMLNIYKCTTVTPFERERVEGMRCLEWQATFSNTMWGYLPYQSRRSLWAQSVPLWAPVMLGWKDRTWHPACVFEYMSTSHKTFNIFNLTIVLSVILLKSCDMRGPITWIS